MIIKKTNKQTKQNQTSPLLDQLPRLSGCLPAKSGRHRLVITPQNNYSKTRAGRLTLAAHRLPIHWRDNLSFSPPLYPLPLPSPSISISISIHLSLFLSPSVFLRQFRPIPGLFDCEPAGNRHNGPANSSAEDTSSDTQTRSGVAVYSRTAIGRKITPSPNILHKTQKIEARNKTKVNPEAHDNSGQ